MQARETRFKDSMMMDECDAMSRKLQLHCQRGCDEPQTAAASLHLYLRSSYAGRIKYLPGTQWVPLRCFCSTEVTQANQRRINNSSGVCHTGTCGDIVLVSGLQILALEDDQFWRKNFEFRKKRVLKTSI
jgi:hypothetical protein